jgi:hypothetical protein
VQHERAVANALYRLKRDGLVLRVDDGWRLVVRRAKPAAGAPAKEAL